MPLPNHPDPPTDRDRALFQAVCVEGRSRAEVAREQGLSTDHVSRVIRTVERYLAARQHAQDPHWLRSMRIDRLEHLWNEVMSAWYRSQLNEVTEKVVKNGDAKPRVEQQRKGKIGDVSYLESARRILMEIERASLALSQAPNPPVEEEFDVTRLNFDERTEKFVEKLLECDVTAKQTPDSGTDSGPPDSAATAGGRPAEPVLPASPLAEAANVSQPNVP